MKKFTINKTGDVELRLDDNHVLIIHAAVDGIVLDVWPDHKDESIWSMWETYNEMLPDESDDDGI